jgi:hypothetical protein
MTVRYPDNVTLVNFLDFLLVPTLVYEAEYPRTDLYGAPPPKTHTENTGAPCMGTSMMRVRVCLFVCMYVCIYDIVCVCTFAYPVWLC